jgi:hypothetical protein
MKLKKSEAKDQGGCRASEKILYTVGRTPWTGISPPQGRYIYMTIQTQLTHRNIRISSGIRTLEPTKPVFERTKTVHALDRVVTVIDGRNKYIQKFCVEHSY